MSIANNYFAMKLNTFVRLTSTELKALAALQSEPIRVQRGKELIYQGEAGKVAFILHYGWGCSFKILSDGARQLRFLCPAT